MEAFVIQMNAEKEREKEKTEREEGNKISLSGCPLTEESTWWSRAIGVRSLAQSLGPLREEMIIRPLTIGQCCCRFQALHVCLLVALTTVLLGRPPIP